MITKKGNYYQLDGDKLIIKTLNGDKYEASDEADVDRWYEDNPSTMSAVTIDRQNIELFDIYESVEKSRKHLLSIRLFVNVVAVLIVLNWFFLRML